MGNIFTDIAAGVKAVQEVRKARKARYGSVTLEVRPTWAVPAVRIRFWRRGYTWGPYVGRNGLVRLPWPVGRRRAEHGRDIFRNAGIRYFTVTRSGVFTLNLDRGRWCSRSFFCLVRQMCAKWGACLNLYSKNVLKYYQNRKNLECFISM